MSFQLSKADTENTPPAKQKPKVRGGIQGASRRRRARSAGGPNHPRYAVEHAKHRSSARQQPLVINTDLPCASSEDVPVSDTTSAVSMCTLTLPRCLSRPDFRGTIKDKIASVAPELADTETHYIRDALQFLGPRMRKVLAGVRIKGLVPDVGGLPDDITVVVNDLSSDMPTHMLAVWSRYAPAIPRRRVTLYPIHDIILAAHCTNVPVLPKSKVIRPSTPGSTTTLPVVPLCIPAPEVFPQLSAFLYTGRVDNLLAAIMPCPVPHVLYLGDPNDEHVLHLLQLFAHRLATHYSTQTLLAHLRTVNGLWRNVCSLGMDDKNLWCALDVAWEVLLIALSVSTGQPL